MQSRPAEQTSTAQMPNCEPDPASVNKENPRSELQSNIEETWLTCRFLLARQALAVFLVRLKAVDKVEAGVASAAHQHVHLDQLLLGS